MTLDSVINEVKQKTKAFDGSNYHGFLAVQVTLKDIEDGVFYVEIRDHALSIEPYSYNDRQANLFITSDDFIKIINDKLDPIFAFTTGKLKIDGDAGKVIELANVCK